ILDEPTNHLDIASCEALESALNDYDGTIITVSHDRYFLDRVATQILFFGEKGVEHFDGGYSEFYEAHHRALAEAQAKQAEAQKVERSARKVENNKTAAPKKNKQKGPTAAELEAEIQTVESELAQLSSLLATEEVARDKERLFALSEQYQTLDDRLQELFAGWEAATAAEEEARAARGK
ncbi:MAG: hypothetical protein U0X75_29835, partial [Acidobacteriota bacterium]